MSESPFSAAAPGPRTTHPPSAPARYPPVARLQEHPHHRQLQLIVAHAVRGGEPESTRGTHPPRPKSSWFRANFLGGGGDDGAPDPRRGSGSGFDSGTSLEFEVSPPPSKCVGTVSNTLGRSPCAEANSLSASAARSSLTEVGMSLADRHSETMPNALATSFSQRCSSAALCARNVLAKLLRVARWAGIGQSGDALCGGRGRGTGG